MLGYLRALWGALNTEALWYALLRTGAVFLCLTVHESCHGLAALALGDPTARDRHRLSLNPLRHIDWLGLAMMFAAGFGWAKPVPIDPRYFRHPKSGMALTALAGPASNFVLAAAALYGVKLVLLYSPEAAWSAYLFLFLYMTARLSVGLGVFNLLPFPPLDGSKVAAAVLPDRLYVQWMRYEQFGMVILLAAVLLGWQANIVGTAAEAVNGALYRLIAWIPPG